jgi:hypothetical protein
MHGDPDMLNNLNEQTLDCLKHAKNCASKAKNTSNAELRDDYLMLEKRWLSLAESYGRTLEAATSTADRKTHFRVSV